jgi:enolase-phosphatase E1
LSTVQSQRGVETTSDEAPSYATIARTIGLAPENIVFLSDVDAELDAARAAGMQTIRLLRPADTPPGATTTHPSAVTFDTNRDHRRQ